MSEELPLTFILQQVCWQWNLLLLLHPRMYLFHHHSWRIFSWDIESWQFFSFWPPWLQREMCPFLWLLSRFLRHLSFSVCLCWVLFGFILFDVPWDFCICKFVFHWIWEIFCTYLFKKFFFCTNIFSSPQGLQLYAQLEFFCKKDLSLLSRLFIYLSI